MMTFSISASNHLFDACKLRSEESTRDNYAADLQRSLQGELSTPELARQFFQSTFSHNRHEGHLPGDFQPPQAR